MVARAFYVVARAFLVAYRAHLFVAIALVNGCFGVLGGSLVVHRWLLGFM